MQVQARRARTIARFWSKVDRRADDECWPWTAAIRNKRDGYGAFWMDGRHHPASRVAWILTHGEDIADGLVACHRCDNPACCNPAHLFLGSPLQNNDDKVTKRRHILGEKVNTAKLTEDQVREIKALRPSSGLKCRAGERAAIAKRYGVSAGTINDVWSRNWKHV